MSSMNESTVLNNVITSRVRSITITRIVVQTSVIIYGTFFILFILYKYTNYFLLKVIFIGFIYPGKLTYFTFMMTYIWSFYLKPIFVDCNHFFPYLFVHIVLHLGLSVVCRLFMDINNVFNFNLVFIKVGDFCCECTSFLHICTYFVVLTIKVK